MVMVVVMRYAIEQMNISASTLHTENNRGIDCRPIIASSHRGRLSVALIVHTLTQQILVTFNFRGSAARKQPMVLSLDRRGGNISNINQITSCGCAALVEAAVIHLPPRPRASLASGSDCAVGESA